MSFDRAMLAQLLAEYGHVARVVVAGTGGSTPREVGAAMLVWDGGQSGTIGGGTLEHEAANTARKMLRDGCARRFARIPLGPAMGQCCGGAVQLLTEVFDAGSTLPETVFARPVTDSAEMPMTVQRLLASARNSGQTPAPQLVSNWMVEPVEATRTPLWVFGAGHVGRAIVATLAPLPDFSITWVDTAAARFPDRLPENITHLIATNPADLVRHAPADAQHLILTFSHALDLELCHRLLGHGFAWAGLIGSATKWVRFRNRLTRLGHTEAQISRICCPIGQPELGKHPQAIAVGVAATLLCRSQAQALKKGATGGPHF